MIFTEIDRKTMETLSTLVKVVNPDDRLQEEIIHVGQQLGVPKDDTIELLEEWDEEDALLLNSEEEKRRFLDYCFSYMTEGYCPNQAEKELYQQAIKNLGLKPRSNN